MALKFSLSMLTLWAVVWDPNKDIPLTFKWAAIWAGPVSLATTKILSFINAASWLILRALLLSNIHLASIFLASSNSFGPGAITILISSLYLSFIKVINLSK